MDMADGQRRWRKADIAKYIWRAWVGGPLSHAVNPEDDERYLCGHQVERFDVELDHPEEGGRLLCWDCEDGLRW